MATPYEITGLSLAIARADDHIDQALDDGDRKAFKLWCRRRRSLLDRVESALLALANGKVKA